MKKEARRENKTQKWESRSVEDTRLSSFSFAWTDSPVSGPYELSFFFPFYPFLLFSFLHYFIHTEDLDSHFYVLFSFQKDTKRDIIQCEKTRISLDLGRSLAEFYGSGYISWGIQTFLTTIIKTEYWTSQTKRHKKTRKIHDKLRKDMILTKDCSI